VVGGDGAAHMKTVTVGIRLPDMVQILSGIGAGDVVIDSGGYGLQDGTKVKIGAAGDGDSGDKGGSEGQN
jgi:HlyD family secretion protein